MSDSCLCSEPSVTAASGRSQISGTVDVRPDSFAGGWEETAYIAACLAVSMASARQMPVEHLRCRVMCPLQTSLFPDWEPL